MGLVEHENSLRVIQLYRAMHAFTMRAYRRQDLNEATLESSKMEINCAALKPIEHGLALKLMGEESMLIGGPASGIIPIQ